MALSITAGDGNTAGQANTQSPQTSAGSGAPSSAPASSVQPGTATALLNSQGGVPLYATALPTVDLNLSPAQPPSFSSSPSPPPKHHVNPSLFAFPILLLVVAAVLVWAINRSVKSTT